MSFKSKAFIGFIGAITLFQASLGVWQWNRRAEKRDFIAAIEKASEGQPKPLAEAKIWDRVEIIGRYLHDKTTFVRSSRPDPKPGERGLLAGAKDGAAPDSVGDSGVKGLVGLTTALIGVGVIYGFLRGRR